MERWRCVTSRRDTRSFIRAIVEIPSIRAAVGTRGSAARAAVPQWFHTHGGRPAKGNARTGVPLRHLFGVPAGRSSSARERSGHSLLRGARAAVPGEHRQQLQERSRRRWRRAASTSARRRMKPCGADGEAHRTAMPCGRRADIRNNSADVDAMGAAVGERTPIFFLRFSSALLTHDVIDPVIRSLRRFMRCNAFLWNTCRNSKAIRCALPMPQPGRASRLDYISASTPMNNQGRGNRAGSMIGPVTALFNSSDFGDVVRIGRCREPV